MAPALIQEIDDDVITAPSSKLDLLPVEATLRRLLLDVAEYIDNAPTEDSGTQVDLPPELAKEKIVLRFTGGWVRDKLLGIPSHDIDVAINKMTGYQFGLRLKEYLEIPGNPEKYGLEGVATTDKQNQKAGTSDKAKVVGGLHKIEANPEKSKHLETVTTKILSLDIDLVNLRKETYTDESRNPTMEFGTPEEDALRRDATVNAMFYNINTQEVEDFTGCGHKDMKARILRTPLEPYQTFKDDPLRILRLIRFASRLDFEIDEKALQAMKDPQIKDALRKKISRERVGIELEKTLRGPDPAQAMRRIYSLDLYETIFSDPIAEGQDTYKPDITGWQGVIECLHHALENGTALQYFTMKDHEDQFLAWQLAAMIPYNDAPLPEPPEPGRKPPPPIAAQVAREGIKSTNKVCDIIAASVRHQVEISGLVDTLDIQRRRPDKRFEGEHLASRDIVGMAIRRWGASWRSQMIYAMLVEVARQDDTSIERKYTAFLQHIQHLSLTEAHTFKPLMDGKALAKALNTPPGIWMKEALDVVMAYQLRNPDTATTESAIAEVEKHLQASQNNGSAKQNGGELSASLIRHFLQLTLRPLFHKTKPSSVTAGGRKVTTTVLPLKMTADSSDDAIMKPWKSEEDAYALDILRWCVAALDSSLVEEVWHLLIPPLLTLVDDWEVRYKTLGVELVQQVLKVTPPPLLQRTGLGEVFEEALMPCLTYLPTLTPEVESVQLLDKVYPTLLTLTHVRFPSTSPQKTAMLDHVLRAGILHTLSNCPAHTYPRLTALTYTHLAALLQALGIESVKHLKYILPTLTATLTHPLATPTDETWALVMRGALDSVQEVVLQGWPRMAVWRGEVLRGVCGGWLSVVGAEEKDGGAGQQGLKALKAEMRDAVAMLQVAVTNTEVDGEVVDWKADCAKLIEAEPRLEGLFA